MLSPLQIAETSLFSVLYRFRVAQNLGVGETVSFAELGKRSGLSEDDTRRFVRLAIAHRIFEEPAKGQVRHNASSAALVNVPGLHDWLGHVNEDILPGAQKLVESLTKYPGSQQVKESGAVIAQGGKEFWELIGQDPEKDLRFARVMTLADSIPSTSASYFLNTIPWDDAASCPKTIVDVGGSTGLGQIQILRRFPGIEKAIVQDRAEILEQAKVPDDLEGRLSFQAGDFFKEQPVKDADVYHFRHIFHDWPDKYALAIIKNQVPALKPGARIVVNEKVLPEPGPLTHTRDQSTR
jgi:hypothetical protein